MGFNDYIHPLGAYLETANTDKIKAEEISAVFIKNEITSKETVERFLNAFDVSQSIKNLVLKEFK
jgi:hypothetical protein